MPWAGAPPLRGKAVASKHHARQFTPSAEPKETRDSRKKGRKEEVCPVVQGFRQKSHSGFFNPVPGKPSLKEWACNVDLSKSQRGFA